ncbi:MAG TPA: hypothetical protein VJL87_07345 [Bdellovibrionota bacterium]|nr:hypothetical protein [Bdellovibrionota bacterium]
MLILGIESSCDDSAAAIFDCSIGRVLSSIVSSQESVHAPYGGVVPELASRQHLKNIPFVIERAMAETKCTFSDLSAVAATYGPGLIGSLLVGLNAAKAIAFARKIPFIGVNHLEGHLLSPFLVPSTAYRVRGTEYAVPGTVVNTPKIQQIKPQPFKI